MRSWLRWSSGRATERPPVHMPGWCPPRDIAWWINFAGARGLPRNRLRSSGWPCWRSREFDLSDAAMVDDQLRLIFTCCHPALAVDGQVALTLRTVCGLTTEEIARGFLVPVATMAQRLVRVKRKIRDARLPFAMPARDRLAERLDGVMLVVYLVFTEGYAATSGKVWIRRQLCDEAIRLGRLLCELIPAEPGAAGVAGADAAARFPADGAGRAGRRNHHARRTGSRAVGSARNRGGRASAGIGIARRRQRRIRFASGDCGVACSSATATGDTDWPQIARLYDTLLQRRPSPVVELNRAAAVAMAEGPSSGLALIDGTGGQGRVGRISFVAGGQSRFAATGGPMAGGSRRLSCRRWRWSRTIRSGAILSGDWQKWKVSQPKSQVPGPQTSLCAAAWFPDSAKIR